MPACLRDRFTVAVEQLECEPGERHGGAGLGVALYDLKMRRQRVIINDVLKYRTVRDLFCRDGPFSRLLKALGNSIGNLSNGVASTVMRYGSVDAIGAFAGAKPRSGLFFS